jgi:hypothetical protein
MYGAVSAKVAEEMRKPEVQDLFAKLVMRTSPKSYAQVGGRQWEVLARACPVPARALAGRRGVASAGTERCRVGVPAQRSPLGAGPA